MNERQDTPQRQRLESATQGNHARLTADDLETLLKLREAGLIDAPFLEAFENQDPWLSEWTYQEFRRDLVAEGYKPSTANVYACYLKTLKRFEDAPVQLRPPSEDTWRDHVHFRRDVEGVTGTTLNNYVSALRALLDWLGLPRWESLDGYFSEPEPNWRLPPDELVPRFWLRTDWPHLTELEARNLAYIFHLGFHVGMRPPSELCNLDVSDVDLDTRSLIVTETKKEGRRRTIEKLPEYVTTSSSSKSLRLYLESVRPELDQGKTDALFLTPDGERWGRTALRRELIKVGRQVWPEFVPYTMRRWYATTLLIETGFNVYLVAQRLGDTVATVERHYLERAKVRAALEDQGHLPRLYARGDA